MVLWAGSRWTLVCICCVQTWLCTLFLGERKSFFSASWFLLFFFPPLPFFCEAAKKTSVAGRKIDKGLTNTISWKIFHFIATMHCLLYCKYLNTSSSEHAGRETGALWFQLRLVIDGIWCSKAEAWLTSAWTNCHCEVVSMWMGDYFSLALSDFVAVKCLSF